MECKVKPYPMLYILAAMFIVIVNDGESAHRSVKIPFTPSRKMQH
jgi:hypothetical protein